MHSHCPVFTSHISPVISVPIELHWQDRQPSESEESNEKKPDRHWLHCLPPTLVLQLQFPVMVSHVFEDKEVPASLQAQDVHLNKDNKS